MPLLGTNLPSNITDCRPADQRSSGTPLTSMASMLNSTDVDGDALKDILGNGLPDGDNMNGKVSAAAGSSAVKKAPRLLGV